MVIDERARHLLFQKLEEKLGPDEAAVLMEHLPPAGWGDVARRQDIEALALATKRDIDALAVTTKQDIEALAVTTRRDFDVLRLELTAQLDRSLKRQTWAVLTSQAMVFLGLAGLVLGAS